MGITSFSIQLDNTSLQYSPGQAVTGKVHLTITEAVDTTEIVISFFGKGNTHWGEEETRSTGTNIIGGGTTALSTNLTYIGKESYFDYSLQLYGDGVNKVTIPSGENVFSFEFQIPDRTLPASCHFYDGEVYYGLKAEVRQPWCKNEPKKVMVPIRILSVLDLDKIPAARNPIKITDSVHFGFCCKSGPCITKSYTPKKGFCPGEKIPLLIDIENSSDKKVCNLTATLTQVWTLYAHRYNASRSHIRKVGLIMAEGGEIRKGQSIRWEVEGLKVPDTAPHTQYKTASKIIQMEYVIQITYSTDAIGWLKEKFEISHPIIVGAVSSGITVVSDTSTNHNSIQ